jgi:hypothetical protein
VLKVVKAKLGGEIRPHLMTRTYLKGKLFFDSNARMDRPVAALMPTFFGEKSQTFLVDDAFGEAQFGLYADDGLGKSAAILRYVRDESFDRKHS